MRICKTGDWPQADSKQVVKTCTLRNGRIVSGPRKTYLMLKVPDMHYSHLMGFYVRFADVARLRASEPVKARWWLDEARLISYCAGWRYAVRLYRADQFRLDGENML